MLLDIMTIPIASRQLQRIIVNPTMEPTDFTSLKTEVKLQRLMQRQDYTIATWKSFAGELQEAEDILAKTDASQAEVRST